MDYIDLNVAVFTGFDSERGELGGDPGRALEAVGAMFSRLTDSQFQRAVVNIDGAPQMQATSPNQQAAGW